MQLQRLHSAPPKINPAGFHVMPARASTCPLQAAPRAESETFRMRRSTLRATHLAVRESLQAQPLRQRWEPAPSRSRARAEEIPRRHLPPQQRLQESQQELVRRHEFREALRRSLVAAHDGRATAVVAQVAVRQERYAPCHQVPAHRPPPMCPRSDAESVHLQAKCPAQSRDQMSRHSCANRLGRG